MITIEKSVIKSQKNFWNNCIFHPTDAVEDAWGRKIIDRMARDKSIHTIRVYAMLEDIVYEDENGNIAYDFRTSDMRLDYLVEMGFDILIAYGMLPPMLVENADITSSVNKGAKRYKGKVLYTGKPKDHHIWEDICYEYTKHICERYGVEKVANWHLHCYNEPDIRAFFLADVDPEEMDIRVEEYMKLYRGFVKGVTRYTDKLCIGGPSLGGNYKFLDGFLKKVKEENLRLDYLALHNYATIGPSNAVEKGFSTDYWMEHFSNYLEIIDKYGFEDTQIVVDEWGMAACGYYNVEECPPFIERETEVFASYYVRLIDNIIACGRDLALLMICLSGQHEMVTDFSGFRNFFTLNFFAKPIYNAYVLAGKLYGGLLKAKSENENIYVVPTKSEDGSYSVLMTYCTPRHERTLPEIEKEVSFEEDITGKNVRIWCIDEATTNPYTLYKKLGIEKPTPEEIKILRAEGNIKPLAEFVYDENNKIKLKLTSNAVYLVEVY